MAPVQPMEDYFKRNKRIEINKKNNSNVGAVRRGGLSGPPSFFIAPVLFPRNTQKRGGRPGSETAAQGVLDTRQVGYLSQRRVDIFLGQGEVPYRSVDKGIVSRHVEVAVPAEVEENHLFLALLVGP